MQDAYDFYYLIVYAAEDEIVAKPRNGAASNALEARMIDLIKGSTLGVSADEPVCSVNGII